MLDVAFLIHEGQSPLDGTSAITNLLDARDATTHAIEVRIVGKERGVTIIHIRRVQAQALSAGASVVVIVLVDGPRRASVDNDGGGKVIGIQSWVVAGAPAFIAHEALVVIKVDHVSPDSID